MGDAYGHRELTRATGDEVDWEPCGCLSSNTVGATIIRNTVGVTIIRNIVGATIIRNIVGATIIRNTAL